jgi:hypothetical protein
MTNQAEQFAAFVAWQASQQEAATTKANPVSKAKAKATPKQRAPLPTAAPSVPLAKEAETEYPEMTKARLEYAGGFVKTGMACERYVDAMEAAFGADWYAVARLSAAERKALSGNEKARAEGIVHARKLLRAAVLSAGHAEKGADMPWSRARNLAKARAGESGGAPERRTPKQGVIKNLSRLYVATHKAIDADKPDRQLVAIMDTLETALKLAKLDPEKLISAAGQ